MAFGTVGPESICESDKSSPDKWFIRDFAEFGVLMRFKLPQQTKIPHFSVDQFR
jgi:hypothetical protein